MPADREPFQSPAHRIYENIPISVMYPLRKRILGGIPHSLRLIEADLLRLHSQIFEYLIECLSIMSEGHSSVMRIVLLYQHVAVEASHLGNRKDTDGSEGPCRYRKHLALCHVCAELAVCRALQAEEGDVCLLYTSPFQF